MIEKAATAAADQASTSYDRDAEECKFSCNEGVVGSRNDKGKDSEGALPRIILRDRAGGVLNTDTAIQREVHRSWLKLKKGEATEEKDWRLPGLPVPVRPDLSRAAPEWIPQDSVLVKSNERDLQQHWKTQFGSPDHLSRPRCASNLHPTLQGVLGPQYTPLYCSVEGCINHPQRYKPPFLPPFVYPAPVYTTRRGQKAELRDDRVTGVREYVFPGFCRGCQRQNGISYCAGCDQDPEPHYHRDRMVRTGGGFSYFRPDPLTKTEIGIPISDIGGVRSTEHEEGIRAGGGQRWRAMLNTIPYVFYDGIPIPDMDQYGVAISINQLYRDIFKQFEQQRNQTSDLEESATKYQDSDLHPGLMHKDDDELIPLSVYSMGKDPFRNVPEESMDRRLLQRVHGKRTIAQTGSGVKDFSSQKKYDPDLDYVLKQRENGNQGLAAEIRLKNLRKSMDQAKSRKQEDSSMTDVKNKTVDLKHREDVQGTKPPADIKVDHGKRPSISGLIADDATGTKDKSSGVDEEERKKNETEEQTKDDTEKKNLLTTIADNEEADGDQLPAAKDVRGQKKSSNKDKKSVKKPKATAGSIEDKSASTDAGLPLTPRPVSTILEDDQSINDSAKASGRGSKVKSKLSSRADKGSKIRPKSDQLQVSAVDDGDLSDVDQSQGKKSPAVRRALKERSMDDSGSQSRRSAVTTAASAADDESLAEAVAVESSDLSHDQEEEEEELDEEEEMEVESSSSEEYHIEPRLPPLPVTSSTEPPPLPKYFPPAPPRILDFTELTKPGRATVAAEPEVPPDFSEPRKQRIITIPSGQHLKQRSNKVSSNQNNTVMAEPEVSDSIEPTDMFLKYCIIHPDRLPLYMRVFEMAVSRQLYRYSDVPLPPAADDASSRDDDDVRGGEQHVADSNRLLVGVKASLTTNEINKIRNFDLVDQTSLAPQYYKVGQNEGDQAEAKINYTLDLLIDKYEQLQEQLDTLTVGRIKKLAELTKQKFPELTKIDYKENSKKKKKKNKKKDATALAYTADFAAITASNDINDENATGTATTGDDDGDGMKEEFPEVKKKTELRKIRPLTDLEIVERLSDKQIKQLNSESELNQVNVQMSRVHDKLKEVDDRIDKLEDEKKLLQLYARDEYLAGQAQRNKKSERFFRQQSALYQKLHPISDVEMNVEELEEALQLINGQLTNQSELHYIFNILNIPGRRRLNLQLFCAVAAMSEKVKQVDPLVRKLINKFDFEALNVKMEKSKDLIRLLTEDNSAGPDVLNSSAAPEKISVDVIQLELDSAGVPREMSEFIVKKFNREKKGVTDYLDVLIYIPLFIALHQRILDTPLTAHDTPEYQL